MTDKLRLNVIYGKKVHLQASSFSTPAKYDIARTQLEVEVRNILAFGLVRANENRLRQVFRSQMRYKCNILRINATFIEYKCKFLTFLQQQKLALVTTIA